MLRSVSVHQLLDLEHFRASRPAYFFRTESGSMRACAEADLVFMHTLTDEAATSVACLTAGTSALSD